MAILIGACGPEVLIRAAFSFDGTRRVLPSEVINRGLVVLTRHIPFGKTFSKRRRLLDPMTLTQNEDAWERAEFVDGERYGIRPFPDIAIEWTSLTKAKLLAIPIAGILGSVSGYVLQLNSPKGQGSHYAGVLRELRVQWHSGSLLVPVSRLEEAPQIKLAQAGAEQLLGDLLRTNNT